MKDLGLGHIDTLLAKASCVLFAVCLMLLAAPLAFGTVNSLAPGGENLMAPPLPQSPEHPVNASTSRPQGDGTVKQKKVQPASAAPARSQQPMAPQEMKDPFFRSEGVQQAGETASQEVTDVLDDPVAQPVRMQTAPNTADKVEGLYGSNRAGAERFTSTAYLLRVLGVLVVLLGLFYLLARFLLPKWVSPQQTQPLIPFSRMATPDLSGGGPAAQPPRQSLFKRLFPMGGKPEKDLRPQILSRLKLGPTKELHVIQVGDRQLVVGSTAQHMTLLAEITPEGEVQKTAPRPQPQPKSASEKPALGKEEPVYKKYLSRPQRLSETLSTEIPEEEEVVLLDDYEDHYERP